MSMTAEYEASDLSPEQVIGRVIVEIRQVLDLYNEKGQDWTTSYFILDNGIPFCLPGEWADGLGSEPVPADAVRLNVGIEPIYGQPIRALLRAAPDSDLPNESLYLLLENGYLVRDVMGGWAGTDSTGIYVHEPGDIDMARLERLWGIKPVKP